MPLSNGNILRRKRQGEEWEIFPLTLMENKNDKF
jgi:hypothetical protein